jgi:hypothetical protein
MCIHDKFHEYWYKLLKIFKYLIQIKFQENLK